MAVRAQQIGPFARWGGIAALALTALLTLGTLAAVLFRADPGRGLGPAEVSALRFTLVQALLSASLSVALAVPAARALSRRRFPGRSLLVALLGAPFLLPAIVAVFGITAVWGLSGYFSRVLQVAGLPALNIYGLTGVVLAHVFFNLPLVTRLILQGWLAVPAEQFRLAGQLGFSSKDTFRQIEIPMLRSVLPGAFVLVFLLCMTSFAVALTLGGGPRATTVELAIYQALRFEFDLGRAALLALIQFLLCGSVAIAAIRISAETGFGGSIIGPVTRWDAGSSGVRTRDTITICLLVVFLGLPLIAVAVRGLPGLATGLPAAIWPAAFRSLSVSLASAAIALTLGLALAVFVDARRAAGRGRLAELAGLMSLAASPFVIGTGLFILIYPVTDPFAIALPVTAAVNAAMALPFVLRALGPALAELRDVDGRLADSLGLSGLARFRLVSWARIRRPLGFAAGLAAALSMGDLGVIALFAPPGVTTLPLLMQQLMGAYQMEAAAGVGLVLVFLTFSLFWLFDRGGQLNA